MAIANVLTRINQNQIQANSVIDTTGNITAGNFIITGNTSGGITFADGTIQTTAGGGGNGGGGVTQIVAGANVTISPLGGQGVVTINAIAGSNVNLGNVSQNIIPATNVTYNIGNGANQWANVYANALFTQYVEYTNTNTFLGNIAGGTPGTPIANTGIVTVGYRAGQNGDQGSNSVAVGPQSGTSGQGANAVAIGRSAGFTGQGVNSIAIGSGAGQSNQGTGAIAIGAFTTTLNQSANSIAINATGNAITASNAGLYVAPIRNDNASNTQVLYYNTSTLEVTYAPAAATYGNANVAAYLPSYSGTLANVTINTNNYNYANGVPISFGSGNTTITNFPGGANTQVQFNSGTGNFDASANFTFDTATSNLVVTGNITATYLHGDGGNLINLPVQYANSNVTSLLSSGTVSTDIITTANVTGNYLLGNISQATGFPAIPVITQLSKEYFVDPVNGLDTNSGTSITSPKQTIANAQAAMNNSGETLNLMAGIYNEAITWTNLNTNILGPGLGSGVSLAGPWTFPSNTSSIRVYGVNFANTVVHSGTTNLYLETCSVGTLGGLTKTGTGYLQLDNFDSDLANIDINGDGFVNIIGGKIQGLNINASGAAVTLQIVNDPSANIQVNQGTLIVESCILLGDAPSPSPIITAGASAIGVFIENSSLADSNGQPGIVDIAPGVTWSFNGVLYDKANSTLSIADNAGRTSWFDSVGVIGDLTATGNVTGSYAFFNDVQLNDLSANAILYTDANRNVWNTDFSYNSSNNTMLGGNINVTDNITAGYFYGDGSNITNLPAGNYGNSNVAAYLPNYLGNIGGGNGVIGMEQIAIGWDAGSSNVGVRTIAIGVNAGQNSQGNYSVALGLNAGLTNQGQSSMAIGSGAGKTNQGQLATAVGDNAGNITQGQFATAIGAQAGYDTQGNAAVAIGYQAGETAQGINSVAIGTFAGVNSQANNSIILNATGANLDAATTGFFVAPIDNDTSNVANALYYNTSTNEITYGPAGGTNVAEAPFNNSSATANITAVAGARYGVDTSGGPITATLPATPSDGDAIFFACAGGDYATNSLSLDSGTNTIMGNASPLILNVTNQALGVFWYANGNTWRTY